jgi:tRNA-Thr(GGU) m(6)t(6)A37 methyltransferase TsaA
MIDPVTPTAISFTPIGVVRSPFAEKFDAPRQPGIVKGVSASIELFSGRGFEHALEDLEGWDRIWVVFVFDRNKGWRPKVLPPRSEGKRRGVFSTRSPHRPNPIGISVVPLVAVEGLTLRIRDVDMLDGTPVLDIKPYVPYADAFPDAKTGWLGETPDPAPTYEVRWSARAEDESRWLREHGIDLTTPANSALALGPQPNAYRRIRVDPRGGMRLAIKEWRVRFHADGLVITIVSIHSGYRERELFGGDDPALDLHRAFVSRFA